MLGMCVGAASVDGELRERNESAYLEDDDEQEDDDDDDDDEPIVCGDCAVDAKYQLSAKALARYRERYLWFDHDASTGLSSCSTCKRWAGPSSAMVGIGVSSRCCTRILQLQL